ncbi:hypothetical protein CVD28_01655 [Bacillus sp. M6-12]|uniref:hypothetical protein n=1 Tax=Bacillus sp. M6-12 TaxID=2054166 RepID=UPI000C7819F9|nr:hypothetical protein [Bacillus sp. M6-12]PLS19139.1 hypothetical protein CVD28_01655 [Bacillus sp. M6-12]
MVMYHTIRLTAGKNETILFDLDTKEKTKYPEDVLDIIDDFNKKGYNLTAVNDRFYFLTKRVD